ncbi:MAG: LD-carboxypeptidase [Pyrinomonadaceae bacterium]|nr:LD-carboxypeptidase [Pyrinomonadaceae bacterium]
MRRKTLKPKRLNPGDTLAVIAPASGVSESTFERGLQNLRDLGFRTKEGKYARGGEGFLSGSDKERLHDLHWAFRDKDIDGIWCMRGGYGASRILPEIDYKLIESNPKVFVGYSDITAIHLAIQRKTGLVTFHGPNAASTFTDYTVEHIKKTLIDPPLRQKIELPQAPEGEDPELYEAKVLKGGDCKGRIIGGNLSLLIALTGTPFGLTDVKRKILFIEDVNEQPYRVDRMLTQLRQSIDMRSLAGIAVGVFTRNEADPDEPSQSLMEVLNERLGNLGIPVIYGLSFGHIRDQFVIPIGIRAEMNTSKSSLIYIERAVK